ncbi:unnamed protein product [Phytophthora fragariaefolia]|uniref:Unnamed protein product n=1 Tax=Phytophthora fragariaefolia TaxID=1490495 RepID=A0A9W6XG74_9STRA|nr:unnamed protein product [Phytophthora fragariaefolia]
MYFHRRFGHLNYDGIERLARDPANGIELTDHTRQNCFSCAEGMQGKSAQPQQNSGRNAPIGVVGGVIYSDLKGPITPMDRNMNMYIVHLLTTSRTTAGYLPPQPKTKSPKSFNPLWHSSSAGSTCESTC